MEHWKSTILTTQVIAVLTPEAQNLIKIHKKAFQWIDPISDEIITNGHSLLNEVLKLMHPDVQSTDKFLCWLPYPQNPITGSAPYGTGNAIHTSNVSCPYPYCTPLFFLRFF